MISLLEVRLVRKFILGFLVAIAIVIVLLVQCTRAIF